MAWHFRHTTHTRAKIGVDRTEKSGRIGLSPQSTHRDVILTTRWGAIIIPTLPLRVIDSPTQPVSAHFVCDGQVMKVGDKILTPPPESLNVRRLDNNNTINQTKHPKTMFIYRL